MAAPKGNQFWRQRENHGRSKIFGTPNELWERAKEYFQWCDDNPWYKNEAIKGGDMAGTTMELATSRPYTETGLCIFLGISTQTFRDYKQKELYKDFFEVSTRIEEIIYTQKFEGAAVGAFNANIIARDLGLVDKKETKSEVKSVDTSNLTDEEKAFLLSIARKQKEKE